MAKSKATHNTNSLYTIGLEAETEVVLLRRCPACHKPHPRALGLDTDKCECGTLCKPPELREPGIGVHRLSGLDIVVANISFKVASFLNNLAKRD